jgi:hypothetical protein
MDRRDDLEGDERQRNERAQQRRIGQVAAGPDEGRGEQGALGRSVSRVRSLTCSRGSEMRK